MLPTLMVLSLTACSSDVSRFMLADLQNNANNTNIQKTGLPPLASNDKQVSDSQFTASIPQKTAASTQNANWMYKRNPDTYRVSTGDTLYSISKRFSISVESLRSANSLDQFSSLKIGQVIYLPRANSSKVSYAPKTVSNAQSVEISTLPQQSTTLTQKYAANNAVAVKKVAYAPSNNGVHIVQAKETLYSISRRYGMHINNLKSLNGLSGTEGLAIGQSIRVSNAGRVVAAVAKPNIVTPTVQVAKVVKPKVVMPTPDKRSSSRFRWPVNGRVISEYGKKSDGRRNDGINLAVPPGTVVKAAENGVVAYAGNELKSYGYLVLLKHSGGWVTAYAHNGSLLVKKGDKVRRGQVISRSGQSGEVSKPQLHFEIRRGALAVNPRKYLSSK